MHGSPVRSYIAAHGTELQLVIAQVGEKRPVGSAALRLRDDPEPHGEIGYWVAAGARRAGVGRRSRAAARAPRPAGIRPGVDRDRRVPRTTRRHLALARSAGFEPHTVELREFKGRMEEFALPPADGGSAGIRSTRQARSVIELWVL